MDIESLRFTLSDKKGRRFSVNVTGSTVNYRDLGGSRTGIAVTAPQAEAIDAARLKVEAVLKALTVPAFRASAAPGKPTGAATRAPAAKPAPRAKKAVKKAGAARR